MYGQCLRPRSSEIPNDMNPALANLSPLSAIRSNDRQPGPLDMVDLAEFARRGAHAHRHRILFTDEKGALTGAQLAELARDPLGVRGGRAALSALLERWRALREDASDLRELRHRAGAFTAASGSILNGTGDARWLIALQLTQPHERGVVDAVLGGAWATGSPIHLLRPDPDGSPWQEAFRAHKPTALITDASALDSAVSWLGDAEQAGLQRWTILLAPEKAHLVEALESDFKHLASAVHVQWVVADAWAGFVATRGWQQQYWRPAPTVGLAVSQGKLRLQSPQLVPQEPITASAGTVIEGSWLNTRLKATVELQGLLLGELDTPECPPAGSEDVTVCGFSLASLFGRASKYRPTAPAVRFDDERSTYAMLESRVMRLAAALRKVLGVRPGDRVALYSKNRPEFVELYWALNHLGAIFVPVNFRLKAPEVAYILRDSGAKLLFIEPDNDKMVGELAVDLPEVHTLQLPAVPASGLDSSYESLIYIAQDFPIPEVVLQGDDAPSTILYTAGTTGLPKGAVRSNKNTFWFALTGPIVASLLRPDESHLLSTPMFHVAGHEAAMVGALLTASQLVILHEVRAEPFMQLAHEEKIAHLFVPPTIGLDLVRRLREGSTELDHLKYWNSASAPLPAVLRDEVFERLPRVVFRNSLGMTETGVLLRQAFLAGSTKPANTIGRPLGTVEVDILDEHGRPVASGEVGEIVVRTPQSVLRYWNNDAASEQATRGGWFHTGDLGLFDPEGDVQIMGRVKEMIITGGENVYSTEVENTLFAFTGVREAAVFGVPHPRWGEAVVAAVVPEPGVVLTEAQLIAHCRSRIAHYKAPLRVFLTGALPRNSMGKVTKFQLQQDHEDQSWT